MVGYDFSAKKRLTPFEQTIAGAASGLGTRFFVQPLDVLKIRFQLQIEQIHKSGADVGKYRSLLQAVKLILREEGPFALWKGHAPAQALSVIYGIVNFQTFEILTKEAYHRLPKTFATDWQASTNFVCGSVSASLATVLSFPFDVVRTRLIGQGQPKVYSGMVNAFLLMCKEEGFFSLYKGFLITVVQVAPNTGFTFAFYKSLSHFWNNQLPESVRNKPLESFICGGLAGFGAKLATYPLDLVKKRLQIRGFEYSRVWYGKTRKYTGLLHCVKAVALEEGFTGFYKGLSPSLLKAVISTGLTFFFYEQTCLLLLHYRHA